ncbi:shikimate dehydrogenase [Gordonia sp. CPCC 205515]|uniref:shikimate dehydrogenase n=1 Tax=Gordonia sp. CPCC 205515 TaxID=3140791 RepID=UPI003AF3F869
MSTSTRQLRIGLIGSGIATSMSPALHTAEAAAHTLPGYRYELIDLPADADPRIALRAKVDEGFSGFNVTHPFKQVIMGALDGLSNEARVLGAVNTVLVQDGKLFGHNTDHTGFGTALATGLPGVDTGRVLLVGAGGAGSAVAFALAHSGVGHLTIGDVDPGRAAELAARVAESVPATATAATGVDDLSTVIAAADGVVNATPIGMVGHPGTPIPTASLRSDQWVADIIYRPIRTELICAAERSGCRVLDGGQMLVAQAAASFDLFTGREADLGRMRAHLADLLAQRVAA